MNYQKIYNDIISRGISRSQKVSGEVHHILPKCLGGDDSYDNLVKLTYREHIICHWLLTKIFPENSKLKYALYMLNNYHGKKINSKTYQILRSKFNKYQSERMIKNNPMRGKVSPRRGIPHTLETKLKISNKTKELFKDPEYRERHRLGVSAGVSGKKHPFFGKKHSESSLKKMCKSKGCKSFKVFKDDFYIGTWWSQTQCCKDLGLKSIGNLNACLKKGTSYKGYSFTYV